jgi:hypothetical protein
LKVLSLNHDAIFNAYSTLISVTAFWLALISNFSALKLIFIYSLSVSSPSPVAPLVGCFFDLVGWLFTLAFN